ncbi:MAG: hypothetical protein JWN96_2245 [Mycobacterium sp.]|nr:hypothetical protein [Mycobacterium sp.]
MADEHPTDWLSSSKRDSSADGDKQPWTRRHKTGLGVAFAAAVAGGVLAGTLGASAATGGPGAATGYGPEGGYGAPPAGQECGGRPMGGTQTPLSESLTTSLKAKALAAVPGGTVDRVETGHGGAAYEALVTKADGSKVRVTFDKNQKVLGVETAPKNGGPRGGPYGGRAGGLEGGGPRGANPEGRGAES